MNAAKGDDGFDAFCVLAHPRLVAALAHVTGDRAVAEELAQEALVRAHDRWGRVSQLDSPLGWTVHVGTNLARSHLRRWQLARRVDAQLVGGERGSHTDPDGADAVAVRQAMARLSLPQREAVVLRYVVGLTAVEAGAVLGVDPATVRQRTKRALDVLREELDVRADDEEADRVR